MRPALTSVIGRAATAKPAATGTPRPPDVALPDAPGSLGGTQDIVAGTVTWTWTAPADNGGNPVLAYKLTTVAPGPTSTVFVSGRTLTYTYKNWARDTDYVLHVHAVTAAGTGPAVSDSIHTATAAPLAPTDLTATALPLASAQATSGSALVQWNAPTGGTPVDQWIVSRSGTDSEGNGPTSFGTRAAFTTSFVLNHLVSGRTYTVTVAGLGDYGTGHTATVTVRVGHDDATPPRNVAVTEVDTSPFDGTATITWAPPAATGGVPITGYVVRVQDAAGTTAATSTVLGAGARSFTTGSLGAGATYVLSVSAITAHGTGPAASGAVEVGDGPGYP